MPYTEQRPWGHFTVLADEVDHKVKRISVLPGQRLSLQRHKHREEHWYFIGGFGEVTTDDWCRTVGVGSTADIEAGMWHRVENTEDEPLVFIEVQTGTYFGEDDIERKEDDYDRE